MKKTFIIAGLLVVTAVVGAVIHNQKDVYIPIMQGGRNVWKK